MKKQVWKAGPQVQPASRLTEILSLLELFSVLPGLSLVIQVKLKSIAQSKKDRADNSPMQLTLSTQVFLSQSPRTLTQSCFHSLTFLLSPLAPTRTQTQASASLVLGEGALLGDRRRDERQEQGQTSIQQRAKPAPSSYPLCSHALAT